MFLIGHSLQCLTMYILICVKFQVCVWTSISLVVPQATLGTAMGLGVSILKAGNGVCNLIIGWILGTTSRWEEQADRTPCNLVNVFIKPGSLIHVSYSLCSTTRIPLWRWQRMMIFMMANTVCSIVTSVLLNIVDGKQVRKTRRHLVNIGNAISVNICSSVGRDPKQDNQKLQLKGNNCDKDLSFKGLSL